MMLLTETLTLAVTPSVNLSLPQGIPRLGPASPAPFGSPPGSAAVKPQSSNLVVTNSLLAGVSEHIPTEGEMESSLTAEMLNNHLKSLREKKVYACPDWELVRITLELVRIT